MRRKKRKDRGCTGPAQYIPLTPRIPPATDRPTKRSSLWTTVVIPSDSNIRKKEQDKLKKLRGLREELWKTWR